MKMIGKLGWRGQCSCCNDKADMKAAEKHAWQREAEEEMELDDEFIVLGRTEGRNKE